MGGEEGEVGGLCLINRRAVLPPMHSIASHLRPIRRRDRANAPCVFAATLARHSRTSHTLASRAPDAEQETMQLDCVRLSHIAASVRGDT